MSTDRQRLASALRKIVKSDPELSAAIETSKNKGGQASSSGIGTSDAERDNLCCDGTEGAGANAGTDQRDPSEEGKSDLDSTDPANLDGMGQGSLTDITDCATGDPLCFDGSDWLPPDGWDGPLDPPEDPTFIDGFYYNVKIFEISTLVFEGKFASCGAVYTFMKDEAERICDAELPNLCDDSPTATPSFSCGAGSGDSERIDCSEDFDPICDEPPPLLTEWPEDSCANLISRGGKIVGSKFDPENDGSYSAPRDEIEVCDADGDRILLRGSPTGGWKSIKSLSGDIDPDTGNGYLYRPNGQRVRQISPSEFRDDTV